MNFFNSLKNETNYVGLYLFLGFIFIFLFLVVICCICEEMEEIKEEPLIQTHNATANILPPVFYTEELTDPLMQVDLKEKITK